MNLFANRIGILFVLAVLLCTSAAAQPYPGCWKPKWTGMGALFMAFFPGQYRLVCPGTCANVDTLVQTAWPGLAPCTDTYSSCNAFYPGSPIDYDIPGGFAVNAGCADMMEIDACYTSYYASNISAEAAPPPTFPIQTVGVTDQPQLLGVVQLFNIVRTNLVKPPSQAYEGAGATQTTAIQAVIAPAIIGATVDFSAQWVPGSGGHDAATHTGNVPVGSFNPASVSVAAQTWGTILNSTYTTPIIGRSYSQSNIAKLW